MNMYRKRPVVVAAILWLGDSERLENFCGRNWARADVVDEIGPPDAQNVVVWNTKEKQWLNLPLNHWLIRGVHGELYPCAPDVFAETYEDIAMNRDPVEQKEEPA